ncbi:unnamed protein product [Ilex paraguariensis]|uniref:Uncharacterized protein n=1 Tax=Ilex paraguariensis TaxID=185542 RepID=A0ABC8SU28_9AQUA
MAHRREDGFLVVGEAVDGIRVQEEGVSITVQDKDVRVMQNDVEIKGDTKENESLAGRKSVRRFRGIKSTRSVRSRGKNQLHDVCMEWNAEISEMAEETGLNMPPTLP